MASRIESRSALRSPRSTFSTQLLDLPIRSAKTAWVSFRRRRQYPMRRPISRSSMPKPHDHPHHTASS